ncbi:prepilin-type N-terminal cleavage/methylation domain-containing protein [Jeotgalibaca sp. MA1X17-3]|uniref:type IV pilus modification PilV family protein n=1 Tax=Jeotgalibaca sp. MA1X17-3 TaxID=2908211 RepID=UPI001F28C41D|nr:prepilin-type N-terminal cleavage/methylation domain-containing protein [Jeotgalibaca sp. MA1X17-3]UJF14841.1 prepilin-type N-terminal cleavage/methylation domain-containing protein [Jeotgalibaca sp. MA1X17-3]
MKLKDKKTIKIDWSNESGVTLIELLASIVLITLIVTTFLSFFIQASKTNVQIDDTNKATFFAQAEMERLTHDKIPDEMETTISGFEVETKVGDPVNNLYTATVTVSKGGKEYAKMETRFPLPEDSTEK